MNLIEIGIITSTHGLTGEFKVTPWCDDFDFFTTKEELFLKDNTKLNVTRSRAHKNSIIVKVKEIDNINEAERLKNEVLFIDKDNINLEKGTYFICDLIGLNVIDIDTNENYGKIFDVIKTGANDVYAVKNGEKEYYIPKIDEVVIDISLEEKQVKIRPLKGLME